MAANDPRVPKTGKALYEAREAQNQIVSWLPEVMVMADAPKPRQTYVFSRGLYNARLDPVDPSRPDADFSVRSRNCRGIDSVSRSGCSIAKNPLIARVFVNRMWQMQFGTGIVETSEDFGMQGSRPTHPELLDWLAVDFMESGWDIKRLNKMIVMSATFRQSSEATDEMEKRDPAKLPDCQRAATSHVCRTSTGQCAGGERSAGENDRRTQRASVSTRWDLGGGRHAVPLSQAGGDFARRTASAQPVHVLETQYAAAFDVGLRFLRTAR